MTGPRTAGVVRDTTAPQVAAVRPDASPAGAAQLMRAQDIGDVLVPEDRDVMMRAVGGVGPGDLAVAHGPGPAEAGGPAPDGPCGARPEPVRRVPADQGSGAPQHTYVRTRELSD
ncbi:hypothetical protein [Streptomyces sp. NPDC088785]|uniref:hypothetical protein n=1 Tax=Streptomyces sp. NPDC088785 TaxID=3365897 RepID=UPI0037F76EFF